MKINHKPPISCQSHIYGIKCPVLAERVAYSLWCERHYCDYGENVL